MNNEFYFIDNDNEDEDYAKLSDAELFNESEEGDNNTVRYVEKEVELSNPDPKANYGDMFSSTSDSSDKEENGGVKLCKNFKGKIFQMER